MHKKLSEILDFLEINTVGKQNANIKSFKEYYAKNDFLTQNQLTTISSIISTYIVMRESIDEFNEVFKISLKPDEFLTYLS